jgi:hypothetical protein
MDQLLWSLLQVGALPDIQPAQQSFDKVGNEEIQKVTGTKAESHIVAEAHRPLRTESVCTLAM